MLKLKFTQVCYLKPSRGYVRPQLRGDLVGYLATESVFFFLTMVIQQFIFSPFLQKAIVSSRSGLSAYSFLAEASRQPSLNRGSPLWQRARAAAFALTSNQINVLSIMGLLPLGQLCMYRKNSLDPLAAYGMDPLPVSVCVCVCIQANSVRRGPHPPWELSIWVYMFSDKVRRLWHIY